MDETFRIKDGVPWVGDRSFPWATDIRESDRSYGCHDKHSDRGFHLACDVKAECLAYAMAHGEKFGIWGGLSERERRRIRRRRRAA